MAERLMNQAILMGSLKRQAATVVLEDVDETDMIDQQMFLRNEGNVGGMTARQDGLEINVEHNECRDIWII